MCFPTKNTHKYMIHLETTTIQKLLYHITFIYTIRVVRRYHIKIIITHIRISHRECTQNTRTQIVAMLAHKLTISAWVDIIFFNEFIWIVELVVTQTLTADSPIESMEWNLIEKPVHTNTNGSNYITLPFTNKVAHVITSSRNTLWSSQVSSSSR